MTNYSLRDYGADPRNPWLENYDNGWGPYAYPEGVPSTLLGIVTTKDDTNIKVRKELVPLVRTMAAITEAAGYSMHTATGGNTGGYVNRAIRGGKGPSTHSRGRAIDIRALDNPQGYVFRCTIPPRVISAWETCGFYWGGRYIGVAFDPQHLSYIHTPAMVAGDLVKAKAILANFVKATQPSEVDADMATAAEVGREVATQILNRKIEFRDSYVSTLGKSADQPDTLLGGIATIYNYVSGAQRDSIATVKMLKDMTTTLQSIDASLKELVAATQK